MIFAVDFDRTLSYGKWPEVGPSNESLFNILIKRRMNGDKIILWTCRDGSALSDAVNWCRENGLEFDAVNDNVQEIIDVYGNNSRKISCDFYIDDRVITGNCYKMFKEA